jgi:hypothetical protein
MSKVWYSMIEPSLAWMTVTLPSSDHHHLICR